LPLAGGVSGIAQPEPKPVGGGVQAAFEIDKGIGRPQMSAQLFARYHLARFLQQGPQHGQRFGLNPDANPVLAQFSRVHAQLERAELQDASHSLGRRSER